MEDRIAAIEASFEQWKQSMSIEALQPLIQDIRDGLPLHPPAKVATIVEAADGSEMWDGSVAIESDEEEEKDALEQEELARRKMSIIGKKEIQFIGIADQMDKKLSNILANAQLRPLEECLSWDIAQRLLLELAEKVSDICEDTAQQVQEETERAKEAKEGEENEEDEEDVEENNDEDGDSGNEDEGSDVGEESDPKELDRWHQWKDDPVGKRSREGVSIAIGDLADALDKEYNAKRLHRAQEACNATRANFDAKYSLEDFCRPEADADPATSEFLGVGGKMVFVQASLNMPNSRETPAELDPISADALINGICSTCRLLLEAGASSVVLFGRRGHCSMDPALLSMKPVANALGHKLGREVTLINDPEWFGEATRSLLSAAKEQSSDGCNVFMLENLALCTDEAPIYAGVSEFADIIVSDSLLGLRDARSFPRVSSCPLPILGNHLQTELRGVCAFTAKRTPLTVAIVGGAFPDAVEGVFFDGDEAIANVDSAVNTQSRTSLARSASPVSSLGSAEDNTHDANEEEAVWPAPKFDQLVRSQLDFMHGLISNERVDMFLIGGGLVQLFKAAVDSMGPGAMELIKDPGPPLTLDESDEEEGDEVDAEREEGSLEYESTNLVTSQSDPPAEENSDADEDEEGEETEESPRNEVKENEEENDSQEDDAEDAEFDEETIAEDDAYQPYLEEVIDLLCMSRKKGIAWRLPLDAVVGPTPPSRPSSDAARANA